MSEKTTIFYKLNKVMAESGRIPKRGYNPFHKYHYVLESDFFDVIRPLMVKHGLAIVFGSDEVQDGPFNVTRVRCIITIGDIDGNEMRVPMWAEGQDKGDKGIYKGYTGCMKYFLYKTFMISTGDDPERDKGEQA